MWHLWSDLQHVAMMAQPKSRGKASEGGQLEPRVLCCCWLGHQGYCSIALQSL
jgi:hypothetical protein